MLSGSRPGFVVPLGEEPCVRRHPQRAEVANAARLVAAAFSGDIENVGRDQRHPVGLAEHSDSPSDVAVRNRRLGHQRYEPEERPGEIPRAPTRRCEVPVDKRPASIPPVDKVPRCKIVMANELRWADGVSAVLTPGIRAIKRKVGDRVVVGTDDPRDLRERTIACGERVVAGVHDQPLDEAQAFSALFVDPNDPGSVREATALEMPEERVDRRRPRPRRTPDGRAHFDDTDVGVPTLKRLLLGIIVGRHGRQAAVISIGPSEGARRDWLR